MKEKLINNWPRESRALYFRTRLSEYEVQLKSEPISFQFPSLSELGVNTEFIRQGLFDFRNKEWIRRGENSIGFTILNLILSKDIELYKFKDKRYFLFKTISLKKEGFYFKAKSKSHSDLLSDLLIKKINEVEKLSTRKQRFEKVINETFISFLGRHKTYNNPPKTLFYKNIEYSSKEYIWLNYCIHFEINIKISPFYSLKLKGLWVT